MRIAMLGAKGIPAATAQGGGVETYVEELATRLVANGHEVTVYTRPYANPDGLTSYKGVKLVTLPTIHTKHLDAITATFLATVHALFQNYDIVHYHGVGPSTLAWMPRLFNWRTKVVATFHSRDRFHEKWGLLARLYLTFAEWASVTFPNATTAPSHSIQLFCKRMFGANVLYIPNGVALPSASIGTDELSQFRVQPEGYFFTLGRFVPHKAFDDVIRAFRNVQTDKKLVIIGSAAPDQVPYERELHRLAGDDKRIIFAGRVTGEPLKQLLAHGYAMVHASRSEGLAVSILESMSYGRMVIMSDIPENLELIDHSGISFPLGDITELTHVLQWAVNDPQLVMERGERARKVIRDRYSWAAIVGAMERLYGSLINRKV